MALVLAGVSSMGLATHDRPRASTEMERASRNRTLLTLTSIAIVACISADMVHEALGHGIASLLTGDRILSISTVAIQNATANRFVSVSGTFANCLAGAIGLLVLRRVESLTRAAYFLWIFAAFNLLNSGYLVASALLGSGDWANAIADLSPSWLWRCALGVTGAGLYLYSLRAIAKSLRLLTERRNFGLAEIQRLVVPAYLAGGAVMTIASIFNPISPSLILLSGAGASFGLNAGLLFVPAILAPDMSNESPFPEPIATSLIWIGLAAVFSVLFVAVLGPGIHFSQ